MGTGRQMPTLKINGNGQMAPNLEISNVATRNLKKSQLGGVIFGCKNGTLKECLFKQLFGLPAQHFPYVKNIEPGLPLFLFNYSDRKLHGIFEAASSGKMNIDPYGWTTNGSQRTQYPAQVQIRIRMQCQPLSEVQFKPIIADNYYGRSHFWFELDHAQTSKLISLLSTLPAVTTTYVPHNTINVRTQFQALSLPETSEEVELFKSLALEVQHSNLSSGRSDSIDVTSSSDGDNRLPEDQLDTMGLGQDEKDTIFKKLQELALRQRFENSSVSSNIGDSTINDVHFQGKGIEEEQLVSTEKSKEGCCSASNCLSLVAQLVQEVEELKAFKTEQTLKMGYLEQKLIEADEQIHQLKDRCMMLESMCNSSVGQIEEIAADSFDEQHELHLDPTESIYLVGGYDGESWLSALDLYFPSKDVIKSMKPMNSVRSYASVAQLHNELYVFGGGDGFLWYDTVESYNPANDQWALRPSLTKKKGSLAGATLDDKIFAIGGGNGVECFSEVEMLDLDVGRWIPTRSMAQKRFALAAVELNGVIYATGGFDGNDYMNSAERFDPREHSWTRIASMNSKRGCHSLVVLNEKVYALGGFDGTTMVSTTEVFDPRLGKWISGEPMSKSRGYSAAAVVKECIYVLGGMKHGGDIVDTVEYFKEGEGWQENTTGNFGKKCFFSAIVL